MARITEVEIGDVRCFDGTQSARTRRITLLVGENGAGKSTFLGCYRTLAKLSNLHDLAEANHFDEPPFHMGGVRLDRARREDRLHRRRNVRRTLS